MNEIYKYRGPEMPATGSSAMTERQPAFRARPLTRGSDQLHRAAHKNSDQDNEAGSVERRANCIRDGL